MNKVISREYVEKNYIHKDKIRLLLNDYIYGDAFELADDKTKVEMILNYLESILEERDLLEEI